MTEWEYFGGFNGSSPTLRRAPMYGDCMRDRIHTRFTTSYFDESVPVRSGDFAVLELRYPDGSVVSIVKQLFCTRVGRWYAQCADSTMPIDRRYIVPHRVRKVVAVSTESCGPVTQATLDAYHAMKAPDELVAFFNEISRPAIEEWKAHGFPDRVAFNLETALDAAEAER